MERHLDLNFEKVTKENFTTAVGVQHAIFPEEHGDKEIAQAVGNVPHDPLFASRDLWLARLDCGELVGILGLYSYKEYQSDAWLDWFGILPKHRSNGYGNILLEYAKKKAAEHDFESLRLWTDDMDNSGAVAFYQRVGFDLEVYTNNLDPHYQTGNTVILSIGFGGKPSKKWDNKNIYLKQFYHNVLGRK